jgi:hypothetical protein
VTRSDSTVVSQIRIETLPGSEVEVLSSKGKRGSTRLSTASPDPKRPGGTSSIQLTLRSDHVRGEGKGGPTSAVTFLLGYKVGKISGSTSETLPMPADAKRLADVLKVPIKSGEYKYGVATKLVTIQGRTYTLVVNRPK